MRGVFLPGGRRVELREVADPVPGPGQVVLRVHASTICGSDLRAIYREHLGEGAEGYRGVVAGHEPCGEVVRVGPDCPGLSPGDRVVVYHISGCGRCDECRTGYQIGCTSDERAAYGWQRDGGHAPYLLAQAADLIALPDSLSYVDGACVACGFGTAYEALRRGAVSGRDTVLITGLGPVGLAAGLLARALGASLVVGTDPVPARRELARTLGAVGVAIDTGTADHGEAALAAALAAPGGVGGDGAHVSIDASGVGAAQRQALRHTRRWGRCVLVGEGGTITVDASPELIHKQITLIGSWVTSTVRMRELLESLDRWSLHPEVIVTDRFGLDEAEAAYRLADGGAHGKVAILPNG